MLGTVARCPWRRPFCVPTPGADMGTAGRHGEGLTYLGLGRAPHPAGGFPASAQLEGKEEEGQHLTTAPHSAQDTGQ